MPETCSWLHERLESLPMIQFPFKGEELPENGIYCFYEKGEIWGHRGIKPRIVRIGTHKDGNFKSRIGEHFLVANGKMKFDETMPAPKDRSIFRKNLGRALLKKSEDKYIDIWNVDFMTSANRMKYRAQRDIAHEIVIEKKIKVLMRETFSFRFLIVNDERVRLGSSGLECALIGTCAGCDSCGPSSKWLGLHSPKPLIRDSGLWLVQHLSAPCLNDQQRERLDGIIKQTEKIGEIPQMPTLAIVQCGQRKIWDVNRAAGPTAAKDAYISPYFRKNRAYAERFADQWVILSAKYGFLTPAQKIQNSNVTFLKPASNPITVDELRRQVQQMKLFNFKEVLVIGGSDYAAVIQRAYDKTGCRIHLPFKRYKGIGYIQQAVGIALKTGTPLRSKAITNASTHHGVY